jgi:hypothetical protein
MAEPMLNCPFCGGKADTITGHAMQGGFFRNVGCLKCKVLFDDPKDWQRRTPPPATVAMLRLAREWAQDNRLYGERLLMSRDQLGQLQAFIAEWPDLATPPPPEQLAASSPWRCAICGKPVRIGGDLQPWHLDGPTNHDAELSDADLKTLADGLRLTD